MKYYDITMAFYAGMTVYPGDDPVQVMEKSEMENGALYNLSSLSFSSHAGTHIDAPRHFIKDGKTVDQLGLDYFFGKARVIEITDPVSVKLSEIKKHHIEGVQRLIIKTTNSCIKESEAFRMDFCYIEPDAAKYIAGLGIKTLGFDYLSIDKYDFVTPEAHYAILGAGMAIVEGLRLMDVEPGDYDMYILPIPIRDGNGSPARAVLSQY